MRRALCVWLPTWATDLAQRRLIKSCNTPAERRNLPSRTVVSLVDRTSVGEKVARCCALAARMGIAPGMALSHARALVPARVHVHVEEHKPLEDLAALRRLGAWALRFSPVVMIDPPDGLQIDATGLERLYGDRGEWGLSHAVGTAIARMGICVRLAVASTFACAAAVARYSRHSVTHVKPGADREVFATLPIAALRIDPRVKDALGDLGFARIGQILELPRASLAAQFGEELPRLLDRALGLEAEPVVSVRSESPLRMELPFDGLSDSWEALHAAAYQLLEQVTTALLPSGLGARRLQLEVRRPDGRVENQHLQLSRASRSYAHLRSLLRPILERIDAGAGIVGVAISVTDLEPLQSRQNTFVGMADESHEPSDEAWSEMIDALVSRLGPGNVLRMEPVESHLPERAFRSRGVLEAICETGRMTDQSRPTRLFTPAQPARVVLRSPDGPVLQINWSGKRQQVIASAGPERIGPEWWRARFAEKASAGTSDRDYFRVQTADGAWLWVGRCVDTGQWFVQGDWA